MTTEERILERLESIEAELQAQRVARLERDEMFHDMNPLMKSGFKILLKELGSVEAGFQLEDLFVLIKRFLRNIGMCFDRYLKDAASEQPRYSKTA